MLASALKAVLRQERHARIYLDLPQSMLVDPSNVSGLT